MRNLVGSPGTRAAFHHMHNMRVVRASGVGFGIAIGSRFCCDGNLYSSAFALQDMRNPVATAPRLPLLAKLRTWFHHAIP